MEILTFNNQIKSYMKDFKEYLKENNILPNNPIGVANSFLKFYDSRSDSKEIFKQQSRYKLSSILFATLLQPESKIKNACGFESCDIILAINDKIEQAFVLMTKNYKGTPSNVAALIYDRAAKVLFDLAISNENVASELVNHLTQQLKNFNEHFSNNCGQHQKKYCYEVLVNWEIFKPEFKESMKNSNDIITFKEFLQTFHDAYTIDFKDIKDDKNRILQAFKEAVDYARFY